MTSSELAEWMAYERTVGPLDGSWQAETLSTIQELVQYQNHILGAAHFTNKKNKKNPVPEPKRWWRPWEMWKYRNEEDE